MEKQNQGPAGAPLLCTGSLLLVGPPQSPACTWAAASNRFLERVVRKCFLGGLCRTEVGSRHRGAPWRFLRVYVCFFSTGGKAIAHSLLLLGSVRLSGCCRPGTGQGCALRVAAPPPQSGHCLWTFGARWPGPAGTPPGAHCSTLPSRPSSVASGGAPGWPPPQSCRTFLSDRHGR